jgi:hypothetical protein
MLLSPHGSDYKLSWCWDLLTLAGDAFSLLSLYFSLKKSCKYEYFKMRLKFLQNANYKIATFFSNRLASQNKLGRNHRNPVAVNTKKAWLLVWCKSLFLFGSVKCVFLSVDSYLTVNPLNKCRRKFRSWFPGVSVTSKSTYGSWTSFELLLCC